jgi:two-component system cell cycle sensor histidine kinase/response regulator CckA
MAYGFIKQSEGYIQLETAPGEGTRFTIYLPRATNAVERPKPKMDEAATTTGTETVLVVEDEIGVRGLVADGLNRAGYRVLVAGAANEAVEMRAAAAGQIALLVTDVVMPDMSGPNLAAHLAGEQPTMRVLYISGYTDDEVLKRGVQQGSIISFRSPSR